MFWQLQQPHILHRHSPCHQDMRMPVMFPHHYRLITNLTKTTCIPFFLNAHSSTFIGTLLKAFSRSTSNQRDAIDDVCSNKDARLSIGGHLPVLNHPSVVKQLAVASGRCQYCWNTLGPLTSSSPDCSSSPVGTPSQLVSHRQQ